MAASDADPALAAHGALVRVLADELARTDRARRTAVLTAAIDAFPVAAALLDRTPIANAAWRALFGAQLPPAIAAAVAGAAPVHHVRDLEHRWPDYIGHLSASCFALETEPGVFAFALETTDDVIARALDIAPDAMVWHCDAAGDVGRYSARWRSRVRAPWRDAVHHADLPRWTAALDAAVHGGEPSDLEARLRLLDGAYRWHRIRLRRTGARTVLCATDVHLGRRRELERNALLARARNARADADTANRIKDEFLAAVSHELRAPLTTMLLWERVLREDAGDEAARVKALDAIHQSAVAQTRLVTDLLDFSRGIGGKLFLDIRLVDVAQITAEAVEAARPFAIAKLLELAVTSRPARVQADATRLRQILDNLLSNAIKFTPSGGRVHITVTSRGRLVAIAIADTGRGIAEDQLVRIFDPFVQGDELAHREGGLGLGLTISRQLAELHHGSLVAASDGVGNGATFTLVLPAAGSPHAPAPPPAVRHAPQLESARVLVVDDDAHVRAALALLLGRTGAVVETADSAEAGHTLVAEFAPNVVICDIGLPGEDGYGFIQRLRASGYKIPSIALTAYAARDDAEHAIRAGFDVHLAKPVSVERLVDALSELLEMNRS